MPEPKRKRPLRTRINGQLVALAAGLWLNASAAAAQDQDGDGLGDPFEAQFADTDRDGLLDTGDRDDDDDLLDTALELGQQPQDGLLDTDGDGLPNYRDPDDDNDGFFTRDERSQAPSQDLNENGIAAYLDAAEMGAHQPDADGDGQLDEDDPDDDDDTVLDTAERDADTDGDGRKDRVDRDDDGDGVATRSERPTANATGQEGEAGLTGQDTDKDGTPDYLDDDDDGDGLPTSAEDPDPNRDGELADARSTVSGVADYLSADDDADGWLTRDERPGSVDRDSDNDQLPNHRDADDDGDGVNTSYEGLVDSDGDGVPDALDEDDDGDTLTTLLETSDPDKLDYDRDQRPNHLDLDSDGDGVSDRIEGELDRNADGLPDYLDAPRPTDDAGPGSMEAGTPTSLDASATLDAGVTDARARTEAGAWDPISTVKRAQGDGCAMRAPGSGGSALGGCWLLLGTLALLRRRRALVAAFAAAPVLPACADEPAGNYTLPDAGGPLDATTLIDAALDAVAAEGGLVSECRGDLLTFAAIRGDGPSFGAALDGNRTHLAFLVPACGDTGNAQGARSVRYLSFATTGAASEPRDVVADGCAAVRDPVPVVRGTGQVSLFYGSNAGEQFDLYLRDLSVHSEPRLQTQNGEFELETAAVTLAAPTALFAATAKRGGASAVRTVQEGQPSLELLSALAGQRPVQLALAKLGAARGQSRAVAIWNSDLATGRGVFARGITDTGAPVGEVLTLSDSSGSLGGVAAATQAEGAALVYSVSSDDASYVLRFRAVAADGSLGDEVPLTTTSERVGEFSLAPFRKGYAIAYRRLATELNAQATIRLLFVDDAGNIGGSRLVTDSGPGGSKLTLLAALDGRLVVLWDEVTPAIDGGQSALALSLHAARLVCP